MIFSKVKFIFLFLLLLSSKNLLAQNTGVSDVARTPDASAVLDVFSTSKGMLVPRVTEAQRTAIVTPATGLLVYQTNGTTPGFYYYTGTTWTPIASGSGSRWSLETGTSNIFYTGFVGVGVTSPRNQLVVNNNLEIRRGTTATDISQLIFTNTINQGNFRIGSDGNDIFWQGGGGQALQMGSYWTTILTGDRLSNSFPAFITGSTIPNRSVLIRSSRDISIPLTVQGNSATQTGNLTEWLNSAGTTLNVVNSAGNFGIGVTVPAQKLDVAGNFKLTGAFMPNGIAGTAGQVLQSAGVNTPPVWVTAGASSNWALGGNSVAALNTLGTTSAFDLPFITSNTERMRILAGGNVGIATNTPTSTLSVNGSLTMAVRTEVGNATLTATDHVVINTGGAVNWTLPAAAAANLGRIYRLVNHGSGLITLSQSVTFGNGATTTTISNNNTTSDRNVFEIISDGTVWRRINY